MQKLVVATSNAGKLKEIKALLGSVYDVVTMNDVGFCGEIEETGSTFEENSYIKAKAMYDFCHLPSLADDSGLMVEALNGAPGVFSARYSGVGHSDEANRKKLLAEMSFVTDRRAKFVSVVTLIDENGNLFVGKGETFGEITYEERGKNGFGYDSLFYSYDLQKTFAECAAEDKNEVSHRSRALADLIKKLWYYKI